MKKLILCASVYLIAVLSYSYVKAEETVVKTTPVNQSNRIKKIYESIDFVDKTRPDISVFEKAYEGYTALKNEGKLRDDKDILTICDFSKSSTEYRMWVIDLQTNKLLFNDYVAHGQGSGDEFASRFSNNPNSHQSSIGFYVTDQTYIGKHGLSLKLRGMDEGYNNAAYDRAIVVHGSAYVSDAFVASQGRLGRSWGCPAVSDAISKPLIETIKDGTCLFIYYPNKKYLTSSHWLNKKQGDVLFAADMKRDTVIEYGPAMQDAVNIINNMKTPLL